MPGNTGGEVYVLFVFAGAGLATFVVGAALPWWITKYLIYTAAGGCVLFSLAHLIAPNNTPSDKKVLALCGLAAMAGILGVGQIVRWGLVEIIKTFSAGIKARQEAGM
jgi:hypothetical protein